MKSQSINFDARENSTGVNDLFIQRWSPRAFEKTSIDDATLTRILEAARWSPSCFNAQPWRIYTSTEDSFDDCLNLLVEANQSWAKDNAVIGFIVAEKHFEYNGEPNDFSGFDCGAAWMSLTLQARLEGLYTHGMGGIKFDEVAQYLNIDTEQSKVIMGFTIGKLADLSQLSDEQQTNETPNSRKALSEIWHQV